MSDSQNLRELKTAYRAWDETKGDSKDAWLNLMGDKVCMHSVGEEGTGLDFAKDGHSKTEAVDYLAALLKDWKMIHWTPDTFVEDGDRIAMFGRCAWTFRKTGKDVGGGHRPSVAVC